MEKSLCNVIDVVDRIINFIIFMISLSFIIYGGYSFYDALLVYKGEAEVHDAILGYKPDKNKNLSDLLAINSEVVGWITVDGTKIDYPILQGEDNFKYVDTNIYGEYDLAGAIFLNHNNADDFSDQYSILYGHHMANGAMFGELNHFVDEDFFRQHKTGKLVSFNNSYHLEVFALLKDHAYNQYIFNTIKNNQHKFNETLEYFKTHATHYRDVGELKKSQVIALSTCVSYDTDGRWLLLAKIVEET